MPKLEQPAGNASTEEWRDYARSVDRANADDIAEMSRDELRERYGVQDGEAAGGAIAADPTPEELEQALDRTAEAKEARKAARAAEKDTATPELVRLSPADWTVDAVEFPHGEPEEEGAEAPRLTVPRSGLEVAADQADDIIAAAARHGFALQKESVA